MEIEKNAMQTMESAKILIEWAMEAYEQGKYESAREFLLYAVQPLGKAGCQITQTMLHEAANK